MPSAQLFPRTVDTVNESASSTVSLSAQKLGVTYESKRGKVPAIREFSADIAHGEFVSVLGPSGCGKSTLLKVASGLLKPSSGKMELNGKPITGPNPEVGIVFQQPTLLPWETVLGNVMLPLKALRKDLRAGEERARELLDLVGLLPFADNYPHELSGGMQQRVGIARGLVHDPKVLLMDEPFAALDAMTREYMMIELQSIWMKTGKSVLFITHSIPEAVFLSDRVLVMSSRPATLIEDLTIEIDRPRDTDTLGHKKFGEYSKHLRNIFSNITQIGKTQP